MTTPSSDPAARNESVMEGGGYYSAHSAVQHAAAAPGFPMFERAATEAPLPNGGEALAIGDYGCAGGVNEMTPIAIAIEALRRRAPTLPIEVMHSDLPSNDFTTLFALLASPESYSWQRPNIYSYGVGRSLYGPVVPDRRLRLGWTAITVHWLSTLPACHPDSSFSNLVTGAAREALKQRSREDWHLFLRERARELVPGGQLVVVGGASDNEGRSGAEGLFRMVDAQLHEMVENGALRQTEFERIFYPTWNRTLAEFLEPIEAGELATMLSLAEQHEDVNDDSAVYPQYARDGNAKAFAAAYIGFVKAVTEPAFFRWIEQDRSPEQKQKVVDTFYAGLEMRIATDPGAATCRWRTVTLRLVRR